MTCGIYKITNVVNGKQYVGLSSNIEERWEYYKNRITTQGRGRNGEIIWSIPPKLFEDCRNLDLNVSHFVFDVLEICHPEQLSHKEGTWLEAIKPEYNNRHKENACGFSQALKKSGATSIGIGLKDLRTQKNIRSIEVVFLLGISESTLRGWEQGSIVPRLTFTQTNKLLSMYGCSVADLEQAFAETEKRYLKKQKPLVDTVVTPIVSSS